VREDQTAIKAVVESKRPPARVCGEEALRRRL